MKTCILTDSTAQFSQTTFTGHALVKVIKFGTESQPTPRLIPLSVQDFVNEYASLSRNFDFILVILSSSAFSASAVAAGQASMQYGGRASVEVIDSQNIGAGLGILVEMAARLVSEGKSPSEVERAVRAAIAHVFTLICIPNMRHLQKTGILTASQAAVGEICNFLPIFMLEDGHLTPFEKVRTYRHLMESFQEFLEEFSEPQSVAFMKGPQNSLRPRPLKQYVNEIFPRTAYSEHIFSLPLSALLGESSSTLSLLELG